MTPLIEKLIEEVGFSSTYENQRLIALCQAVARTCVKNYGKNELSVETAQRILDAFGCTLKD